MSNQHSEPKFDTERYSEKSNTYLELADAYANNLKTHVSFHHADSKREVYFKAFITNLVETYNCSWTKESIYGRVDRVPIFKQNERVISLSFKIPAATIGEAYENLGNVQQMIQFMYPSYSTDVLKTDTAGSIMGAESRTITKPPYVRLKVMNLIRGSGDYSEGAPLTMVSKEEIDAQSAETAAAVEDLDLSPQGMYDSYTSSPEASRGLLGIIRDCTVLHNLDGDEGVFEKGQNTILPKLIELSMTFLVIHEQSIGYMPPLMRPVAGEDAGTLVTGPEYMRMFPYGVNLSEDESIGLDGEYANTDEEESDDESDAAVAINQGNANNVLGTLV
jgi:hypothetical protein